MDRRAETIVTAAALLACCAFAVYIALFRPNYLTNTSYLGGLLFLQVLLVAVWRFRQRFLPLVVLAFLAAGTSVPFHAAWTSARWAVLAVAAVIGVILYLKEQRHHFGIFHFIAFACVLSALVSAVVSAFPDVALFKAVSLLLLFLYAACGARLAFVGREEQFFRALLIACEVLVYLSAFSYLIVHFPVFGNPNSLGAVMGVIVAPLLFWSVLSTEARSRRRTLALILCLFLLFYSQARAAMVAAIVSSLLVCLALRRYRLVIQAAGVALVVAFAAMLMTPVNAAETYMPSRQPGSSFTTHFLYKDKREAGVMSSRLSPWDETLAVIGDRPWFGSGFGTTINGDSDNDDVRTGLYASTSKVTREHGNSYLAIMEGVGLLGLTPFALLILLTMAHLGSVFSWVRHAHTAKHFAVPVAMVVTAGLIHATFEDWLFAVGYYLCVFFWIFAFVLIDLLPTPQAATAPLSDQPLIAQFHGGLGAASPANVPPLY